MGNSLNRDIKEGEIVILAKKYIDPLYWQDRRVRVEGGFGMSHYTAGTALAVVWLSDGEECRMEGFMIDPEETRIFQEENRWGREITPDPVPCPMCGSFNTRPVIYGKKRPVSGFTCDGCGTEWEA